MLPFFPFLSLFLTLLGMFILSVFCLSFAWLPVGWVWSLRSCYTSRRTLFRLPTWKVLYLFPSSLLINTDTPLYEILLALEYPHKVVISGYNVSTPHRLQPLKSVPTRCRVYPLRVFVTQSYTNSPRLHVVPYRQSKCTNGLRRFSVFREVFPISSPNFPCHNPYLLYLVIDFFTLQTSLFLLSWTHSVISSRNVGSVWSTMI